MSNNENKDNPNLILQDEKALLLDHNYDGIQELDHPLPMWWIAIFFLTIVFSIGYVSYYMTGVGPTLKDELKAQLTEIDAKKPKAPEGGLSNALIVARVQDAAKVANGKAVFDGKCVACHGPQGQGVIGPNLTDDNWIHGKGAPIDIADVVRVGVPEKGMPPWGSVLSEDELLDVVAYVRSLHGSNPPNAKEAQGEKYDFFTM